MGDETKEDARTTFAAGWKGNDVEIVQLEVRGSELLERRGRAVPGRTVAGDVEHARPLTTVHPDAGAAHAALEARVHELAAAGFRVVEDVQSLVDLPAPPDAVAAALRETLVPAQGGPLQLKVCIGGRPRLYNDQPWPTCTCCGGYLVFVAELPLQEDPRHAQVFMCRTGGREGSCAPRFIVFLREVEGVEKHEAPPIDEPLAEEHLTHWRSTSELPSGRDLRRAGLRYKGFVPRPLLAAHQRSTKLGGWPSWGDFGSTPRCPGCFEPMEFVGQLRDRPTQLMWGAPVGILRVFACKPCGRGSVEHDGA